MPPRKRGRKPAVSKPEPADQVKTDPEPEPVDQVEPEPEPIEEEPKVDLNTIENNDMEEEMEEEEVEYEEIEEEVEYEEVEEEEEEEEEEVIEEEQEEETETKEGRDTNEQKEAKVESENEEKIHAELLSKPPQGSEVYIGGIPTNATEEELKGFCEASGEVVEVCFIIWFVITFVRLFQNFGYCQLWLVYTSNGFLLVLDKYYCEQYWERTTWLLVFIWTLILLCWFLWISLMEVELQ